MDNKSKAAGSRCATQAEVDDDDAPEMLTMDNLTKRVEAYTTFEVSSSLLFGFSISFLFNNAHSQNFDNLVLEIVYTVIMNVVLILSAYSLFVISITHYFVSRFMADEKCEAASIYLHTYRTFRRYARWSFYVAIVALIISLIIYLHSQLHIVTSIVSMVMLGFGSFFLSYTMYKMLNPHRHEKYIRSTVTMIELKE